MDKKGEKNSFFRSSIFTKSKRGQGLSVNAIILIVLGLVILVALIAGFTLGFKNLAPWLPSGDNVATIANACNVACTTQSQYDFCGAPRDLKVGDKELKEVTCSYLSEIRPELAISKCSVVTCDVLISGEDNEAVARGKVCNDETKSKFFQYLGDDGTLKTVKCVA